MTTNNDPEGGVINDWARETLQVADQPDLTSALLQQLEDDHFTPSDEKQLAIGCLTGSRDMRKRCREEAEPFAAQAAVDRFVEGFFDVPKGERQWRCRQMELLCEEYPWLKRRLARLKSAVDIDPPEFLEGSREAELVDIIRKSFAAGQLERSRVIHLILHGEARKWHSVFTNVHEANSRFAELIGSALSDVANTPNESSASTQKTKVAIWSAEVSTPSEPPQQSNRFVVVLLLSIIAFAIGSTVYNAPKYPSVPYRPSRQSTTPPNPFRGMSEKQTRETLDHLARLIAESRLKRQRRELDAKTTDDGSLEEKRAELERIDELLRRLRKPPNPPSGTDKTIRETQPPEIGKPPTVKPPTVKSPTVKSPTAKSQSSKSRGKAEQP